MPSLRESFPLDATPTRLDVYRLCEWFQVRDVTGATQRAVAALLLPSRFGIASDLRDARDAIAARLQVLAERPEVVEAGEWTDAHEKHLDIAARLADESQLPDGLTWAAAPPWANGLVSNSVDAYDARQLVWVPDLVGQVFGQNAMDFRHMKRGSGQSCSLGSPGSQWVILATRPAGAEQAGQSCERI